MLDTLFLLAQASPNCRVHTPIVVCFKYRVREEGKPVEYYIRQTNGGSDMQVNRCSWLSAKVGEPWTYVEESKHCVK